jgi:hypothetical protein
MCPARCSGIWSARYLYNPGFLPNRTLFAKSFRSNGDFQCFRDELNISLPQEKAEIFQVTGKPAIRPDGTG